MVVMIVLFDLICGVGGMWERASGGFYSWLVLLRFADIRWNKEEDWKYLFSLFHSLSLFWHFNCITGAIKDRATGSLSVYRKENRIPSRLAPSWMFFLFLCRRTLGGRRGEGFLVFFFPSPSPCFFLFRCFHRAIFPFHRQPAGQPAFFFLALNDEWMRNGYFGLYMYFRFFLSLPDGDLFYWPRV